MEQDIKRIGLGNIKNPVISEPIVIIEEPDFTFDNEEITFDSITRTFDETI
jgi:hypothetical protein